MALFKRRNSRNWWIRFTDPQGKQVRLSSGTTDRRAAQEYEDTLRAQLWRQAKLGDRPRYKWQHAVEQWLAEHSNHARPKERKQVLRWLHPHLYDMHLDEIDKPLIEQITQIRIADGVSNASVNRTLEVIRAILRRAADEWEWIERAPKVRMLPERQHRIRWLTRDETTRLLAVLPEHLEAMVRFSLATGLRERNVTQMEWSQVDLERRVAWVHADQAKARKPIAVPLNDEAVVVLRRQLGKHRRRVFTYKCRPVDTAHGTAWRNALKRAEIENFRWHDLRHTWASWHVQNGTPLNVLQELGGWASYEMVQRYAHLSADHLAEYAANVSRPRLVEGTFLGTVDEDAVVAAAT